MNIKKIFNTHRIIATTLTVMVSIFLVTLVVYATTTIGTSIDTGGYASSTSALNTQGSLHVGVDAKIENKATTTVAFIVGSSASNPGIDLIGGDIYAQGDIEAGGAVTSTTAVNTQGSLHVGVNAKIENKATTTVAFIVGSSASNPGLDLTGGDIYAQGDIEAGGAVTSTTAVNTKGALHIGGAARIDGITTTTAHIYLPLVKFQIGVATSTKPQKGECFMPDDRFKCYDGANWICMNDADNDCE